MHYMHYSVGDEWPYAGSSQSVGDEWPYAGSSQSVGDERPLLWQDLC